MDATVGAALTTALTTLQGDAVDQLAANLPLAIVVTITVAVLFFGIRTFRAIAHV